MTTHTIYNQGNVVGTVGDRLVAIYEPGHGGVTLTGLTQNPDGSYSGTFDGPGTDDITFQYISHFTFIDNAGGNDYIETGDGDDSISSGAGDDTVLSGAGSDTLDGGAGTDWVGIDQSGATADITVDLNGSSTLPGGGSITNFEVFKDFHTGSGDDSLTGHDTALQADWISTGAGSDTVTLQDGTGMDTVAMGAGDEDRLKVTYDSASGGVLLSGLTSDGAGGWNGTFDGDGNADVTFTGVEHFTFTDEMSGDDTITTMDGDDSIEGGKGDDLISTGAGDDTVSVADGTSEDTIAMGAGGEDRLVVTYDSSSGGVTLGGLISDGAGGWNGSFNGYYDADVDFTGVEHFTFTALKSYGDNITTADGDDAISTGGGNDTVNAGTGADTLDGGAGTDRLTLDLSAATGDVTIDMEGGLSTLPGGGRIVDFEVFPQLTTGAGDDTITGNNTVSYSEVISTGAGDDRVSVFDTTAQDTIHMGDGDEDRLIVTYDSSSGGVTLGAVTSDGFGGWNGEFNGYYDADFVFTGVEHFTFTALTSYGDNITTGDGDDVISTGGGNDTVNAGAGANTLDGGAGTDHLTLDLSAATAAVTIDMEGGAATLPGGSQINSFEIFPQLTTGAGDDTITGNNTVAYSEVISTGAGDDRVSVFDTSSQDTVNMGAGGDDHLIVTYDDVTGGVSVTGLSSDGSGGWNGEFNGSYEADIVFTGVERFTFIDLVGYSDNIATGDGDDSIAAGGGNDTIDVGTGADTADGGSGTDWLSADLRAISADVTIDLNTGSATLPGGGQFDNFEYFKDLKTGAGDDAIATHDGHASSDLIDTGLGSDTVTVSDGTSEDTIAMGDGDEDRLVVVYDSTSGGVTLSGLVSDSAGGWNGAFDGPAYANINFTGVEHFTFTDLVGYSDYIVTRDGDDVVNAGLGNDTVDAGDGANTLDGGGGIDRLYLDLGSVSQAVTIDMNGGAATLPGGTQIDSFEVFPQLTTGAGNDSLTGNTVYSYSEVISTGAGDDTVSMNDSSAQDTVNMGDGGDDMLIVTYDNITGGVVLSGMTSDGAGGWNGEIDGYSDADIVFTGVEHISFTDLVGYSDFIATKDGNDTINAGTGNDTVDAGTGVNRVDGGAGTDIFSADYSADAAGIALNLNVKSKVLGAPIQNFEAFGTFLSGSGNDTITGHKTISRSEHLTTGAGDDVIRLWAGGDDTVFAGLGDDLLAVDATALGAVVLSGMAVNPEGGYDGLFNGPGSDEISFHGIERFDLALGAYGDNITLGLNDDVVLGGAGNDTLNAVGGNDTLDGEAGNDIVTGADGDELLRGGTGNDTLTGGAGNDTIGGDAGADSMDGGDGIDTLLYTDPAGGVFIDLALGTATGGEATGDTFTGFENVTTGDARDRIYGDGGNNDLRGNGDKDVLRGAEGDDTLTGGKGNDLLRGDAGADVIDGRGGNDTALYTLDKTGIVIDLAAGTASGGEAEGDTLIDIEHVSGGKRNDRLFGSDVNNKLWGNKGNDTLLGGDGDDKLFGGRAADRILGEAGDDQLEGGEDADLFVFKPGEWDHDTLLDFEVGLDTIRITGGYSDADITLLAQGLDTLLTLDPTGDTILFLNTAVGDLSSFADFEFV